MTTLEPEIIDHKTPAAIAIAPVKNSPAMLKVIGDIRAHVNLLDDRTSSRELDIDGLLARLVARIGAIPASPRPPEALRGVGAATFAWLEQLHQSTDQILIQVADERRRQRKLFAAHQLPFRVDAAGIDWKRKLRVLTEELGEVAAAVDRLETHPLSRKHRSHLIEELVQVAAVTVAWLESFEAAPNPIPAE
jgi:hypothetical protein